MKKLCIVILACLVLCGCTAAPTFENVEDVYAKDPVPEPRQILLEIPAEASAQVLQSDSGKLYLCDGYEVAVQTFFAVDLEQTMRAVTGFGTEGLTVMETSTSEIDRYECAWSAAGEGGDTIARAIVLDDGDYHYCLTIMAPSGNVSKLSSQWQSVAASFRLE